MLSNPSPNPASFGRFLGTRGVKIVADVANGQRLTALSAVHTPKIVENTRNSDTFEAVERPVGGVIASGNTPSTHRLYSKVRGGHSMADKSLNKTELVARIASETGQSQAAVSGVIDSLFSVLADSVSNDVKVSIPGWLAVERTARAARTGRNPQTGAEIAIPAGHSVKVSAGSKLKAAAK
jgi:DNA-binding protein HU-beta